MSPNLGAALAKTDELRRTMMRTLAAIDRGEINRVLANEGRIAASVNQLVRAEAEIFRRYVAREITERIAVRMLLALVPA